MNILQDKIERWLSRGAPERSLNHCLNFSSVLATDIGLERTENQDRVAALKINTKSSDGRPLIAVAVADGMGGMRDGAKCASLALSSFFCGLIAHRREEIVKRATSAIFQANNTVFSFAAGKGGATLSAVLVDSELRPYIVHLGDSRIYSFGRESEVTRLTTDDSLAEAVGGHGRELLQFIGMGEGMQPHIMPIPDASKHLAITTDGIHFIESSTLESVMKHSRNVRVASDRLSALARWCGGPDNASSALIDLPLLMHEVQKEDETEVELWDSFGDLTAIWIRPDTPIAKGMPTESNLQEHLAKEKVDRPEQANFSPGNSRQKAVSKKPKQIRKDRQPQQKIQFEIKIEQPAATEANDEDRQ